MISSDPNAETARRRLSDLRQGLLKLHKTLLDAERERYEHDVERIQSTGQLLGLVLSDPWFAWLHELSQLIVMIDEALDAKAPAAATDADAARFLAQVRALLTPSEEGNGFRRQYFEALQRDPGIVIAHGEAMQLLGTLG